LFGLLTFFRRAFYTLALVRTDTVRRRRSVHLVPEGMASAALVGLGRRLAAESR
jgi:hypothetical protein